MLSQCEPAHVQMHISSELYTEWPTETDTKNSLSTRLPLSGFKDLYKLTVHGKKDLLGIFNIDLNNYVNVKFTYKMLPKIPGANIVRKHFMA